MPEQVPTHHIASTKENNAHSQPQKLHVTDRIVQPNGSSDRAGVEITKFMRQLSEAGPDETSTNMWMASGNGSFQRSFRAYETPHKTTIDAAISKGMTTQELTSAFSRGLSVPEAFRRQHDNSVYYRIEVLKNGAHREVQASVKVNHGDLQPVSPDKAAMGIRKRIEGILDADPALRAQLIEEGFQLPKDLQTLLPQNMRDIHDLPDVHNAPPTNAGSKGVQRR